MASRKQTQKNDRQPASRDAEVVQSAGEASGGDVVEDNIDGEVVEAGDDDGAAEEAGHDSDGAAVEDDETGDYDEQSAEDTRTNLKGLLEALLFVSDRPLSIKELARAARIDRKRTAELVEELRGEGRERGIRIEAVADGLAFRSNPIYSSYVRSFLSQRPVRLSRAQLETLAIVAYRQPITRPGIDDVRGVDCGPVLKGLLDRDLVRILGKKDEPGRPMLYGTTSAFLELFSLHSLRDLPTLKEFTELSDESREKFEREIGEEAPEGPLETDAGKNGSSVTDDETDTGAEPDEDDEADDDDDDEAADDEADDADDES